ncbi:MAG: class I SAM-dependent methyltransferase [Elusimicrobia bacterium]|nr:class I SAM-dependent methyltransferase [Elusimicrobiota bacterium]
MELENTNCCLCNNSTAKLFLTLPDHLFGVPGIYNLVKCTNCEHIYLNPRPTKKTVTLLYEKYYSTKEPETGIASKMRGNFLLRSIYHKLTGEFLAEIIAKASGKVLDIGCGQGILLEDLKAKGCEVYGVEINSGQAEIANKKKLNVVCGDIYQAHYPDEFFDCIVMNHTIEHMPNPESILNDVRRILKPVGKVFINCPNVNSYSARIFKQYWAGWHIPFHFNYFSIDSIKQLANICKFDIISIRTATPGYRFLTSLDAYKKNDKAKLARLLSKALMLNKRIPRLILSIILRIPDTLLPGKGECIYLEMKKA